MKTFILLTLILSQFGSLAISIGLESRTQKCFYVDVEESRTLTISYVVSGMGEDQLEMTLTNSAGTVLERFDNRKDIEFRYPVTVTEEFKVCFKGTDSYYKYVSFDFDISGIDKNYATKNQVEKMSINLSQAHLLMQSVFRNQHFQQDRESVHAELIQSTEKKVKICALGKVTVLLFITLAQIYMLTNFFKDKSFAPSV